MVAANNFTPQAMTATPQIVADSMWYFDTGATHHVTPHSTHLDSYIPGNMSLYTCTGDRTPVTGIGTSVLHSPLASLMLIDVLVVHAATKNLLSVQRLTRDNSIHVDFTDSSCIVKDKMTQQPLVQWTSSHGMYRVNSASPPLVLACLAEASKEQVEFNIWHCKLGHPSDRILKQILSNVI